MRTYIYTETSSPERGCNVRISVWRIKRNQPHGIGHSDHHTKGWKGARGQAISIIHHEEGIPYAKKRDGGEDRYQLRAELGFCDMYEDRGHYRDAVRLFGI